jgi:hypothetical protein
MRPQICFEFQTPGVNGAHEISDPVYILSSGSRLALGADYSAAVLYHQSKLGN